MRKVINKMVSEEDLIRTVATAYGNGWRQVKLYFMCGLPTETDEDVLQIADMAMNVIAEGPRGLRPERHPLHRLHRRLRPQAAHPLPVGARSSAPRRPTPGWTKLRDKIRGDKKYGRSIGFRYHDGKPGIVEGLLSRGDRRVGAVIRAVYEDGGRFDGWREHFSLRPLDGERREDPARLRRRRRLVHHARAHRTRRSCPGTTSTPASTRTGSGRTGRTPSTRPRSRTAAGRRASTAACARRWTLGYKSAPPVRSSYR